MYTKTNLNSLCCILLMVMVFSIIAHTTSRHTSTTTTTGTITAVIVEGCTCGCCSGISRYSIISFHGNSWCCDMVEMLTCFNMLVSSSVSSGGTSSQQTSPCKRCTHVHTLLTAWLSQALCKIISTCALPLRITLQDHGKSLDTSILKQVSISTITSQMVTTPTVTMETDDAVSTYTATTSTTIVTMPTVTMHMAANPSTITAVIVPVVVVVLVVCLLVVCAIATNIILHRRAKHHHHQQDTTK